MIKIWQKPPFLWQNRQYLDSWIIFMILLQSREHLFLGIGSSGSPGKRPISCLSWIHSTDEGEEDEKGLVYLPQMLSVEKSSAPYSGLGNISSSFISLVERTQLFESVPVTIWIFNLFIFIVQTRAIKRCLEMY